VVIMGLFAHKSIQQDRIAQFVSKLSRFWELRVNEGSNAFAVR
jgi:hypothetical protein